MVISRLPRIDHMARTLGAPIAVLFVWDVAVTAVYLKVPHSVRALELPLSLFGTVIALFIGFMANASYARWWEARGAWGAMTTASRNLAREALTFCGGAEAGAARNIAHEIVRLQIGYVNLLRTTLRGTPPSSEAAAYLPAALFGQLDRLSATAVVTRIGRLASEAVSDGLIDPFARVRIETTLVEITGAQGAMERIKNTPLPSHYRFFPYLFARVFCVLLPFAVVDDLGIYTPLGSTLVGLMFLMALQIGLDLMDPFANGLHDVPLTTICRTIETDLLAMMGEAPPDEIVPKDGVLW